MKKFIVGIPKEIKSGEKRVGLTPKGVHALTKLTTAILVEKDAGVLSGFSDENYASAGATLVSSAAEIWSVADLVQKVKEPQPQEFPLFRPNQILFTFLHLASPAACDLVRALVKSKVVAIGYETVELKGQRPILEPMSRVAGTLGAYFGAESQALWQKSRTFVSDSQSVKIRFENLASQYPEAPKDLKSGRVLVLGGGVVGEQAALMSARLGGSVTVTEPSEKRRAKLSRQFEKVGQTISVVDPADASQFETLLCEAEIIISGVHATGHRAPLVVNQDLLASVSHGKKKVIVDIAIDQGGNIAQSKPRTYEDSLYEDSCGNLRFCVANIPSLCGRGAVEALEAASLKYTMALTQGLDSACALFPELKSGICVSGGIIVHHAVRDAHQRKNS